jgi:predicted permease
VSINLLADIKFTARELCKRSGFALTAILSLALGIGATSAVFSIIYAVLIDPFPYRGADRIMVLRTIDKTGKERSRGLNGAQIFQLRHAKVLENIVAMDEWNLTTTDRDLPEDVPASFLSSDGATQFGVPPLLGRWFVKSDAPDGQDPQPVVVLGYQFWQRYYGGERNVVGRTLQLVHKNYQIIGIMPPRFRWYNCDIYLPQKLTPNPNIYFDISLKLRPGVTVARANSELQPYLEQFARESGNYPPGFRVSLRSITEAFAKPAGPVLYLLLGAVSLLLVIGCANVSILLLARGTQRQHEIAVRAAVGADRSRIVTQLLTESLLIALAGAALGVAIAWKGLGWIAAALPQNSFPAESAIGMNLPVLLFSTALAIVTTLIFGLSPALQLSRPNIAALMQSSLRRVAGTVHGRRTHSILIASQVALTVLLLASAGAAGRGFLRLLNTDLGYDPRNTMSVPIPVHQNAHLPWADRVQYFEQLRARVAAIPQVEVAGISTNATPPSNGNTTRVEIMGSQTRDTTDVRLNFISPEYFSVLRIPLVTGRLWNNAETARGAAVGVVNQAMVRRYWPTGNVVGEAVRFPDMKDSPPYGPAAPGSNGWIRIIGVVADARDDGLRNPVKPAVYVPYSIAMQMNTQILVRAHVEPLSLLREVRAALLQVDPEQQVMKSRDLSEWISTLPEFAQQRLVASLFGIFATLGLILAAVGLYSVVSYAVANRTNEFGVRMALGARRMDVLRVVFTATYVNVGAGILAGLVLNFFLAKVESRWIVESARDPLLLAGASGFLIAVSSLACFIPARRAASTDPVVALRWE